MQFGAQNIVKVRQYISNNIYSVISFLISMLQFLFHYFTSNTDSNDGTTTISSSTENTRSRSQPGESTTTNAITIKTKTLSTTTTTITDPIQTTDKGIKIGAIQPVLRNQ